VFDWRQPVRGLGQRPNKRFRGYSEKNIHETLLANGDGRKPRHRPAGALAGQNKRLLWARFCYYAQKNTLRLIVFQQVLNPTVKYIAHLSQKIQVSHGDLLCLVVAVNHFILYAGQGDSG